MGFNPISDKGIRTQRYRCSKCLKRFSFDHEGKLIKRGGFQREHVNLGIPCPQCGKTENVRTHGHSRFGKQKYFCVACPRYFVLNPQIGGKKGHIGYVGRRVLNRQPKHIDDLPFVDCSGLLKNFNKFPQTVDSIIAIPCFNCGSESFCQPQECMKLENYLHEGIENETD
ncbi:hypothetical protein MUP77_18040, partial [Candidatus Bathyarchaeota archaeon]|nr:hypothetical protein [Candidatus Bathyarchaeota archaeon]